MRVKTVKPTTPRFYLWLLLVVGALSTWAFAPAASAEEPNWIQKAPINNPTGRYLSGMANDMARAEVVLFGGRDNNNRNDTWVWDGTNWTRRNPVSSPPPRQVSNPMVYDQVHGEVVLFGGYDGGANLNDTWVWDGANWTQKHPPNNPTPRSYSSIAYDADRRQMVLFGGHDGSNILNDTWIWDGIDWTKKNPLNRPTARYQQAMSYDSVRRQIVLFGGNDGTYPGDTWVWDGMNWTQMNPLTSPTPRVLHAMAYDAGRRQVVLFGGYDSSLRNDTWVWDGATWIQISPATKPSPRQLESMTYDHLRGQVILFGGSPTLPSVLGDTWVFGVAALPLTIVQTNRTPIAPEITPPVAFSGAYPQQLKTFVDGVLTTNVPPDPNKMTIVLTHGLDSSPDAWATNMAHEISLNVAGSPNILVWDWHEAAAWDICEAGQFAAPARETPRQGFALGQALISKLGLTYSNRIHFIGHSLGTLVNGHAAIWIHDLGFAPANTHMTLFDEAEVATDLGCVELLKVVLFNHWNPLAPKPYYYRPLPPKFGWADNYISSFGLLHPDAHNVILTIGFPANAANLSDLKSQLTDFHGYSYEWYAETVITDISAMGHRWSFERNGFAGAPSTNTVFLQSFNGSQWNLAQTNFPGGSNYLDGRFQKYRDAVSYAITHRAPDTVQANGTVTGEMLATGPLNAFNLFIISLLTKPGAAPELRPLGAQPRGAGGGRDGNLGAYAWLPLRIPAEAVSMSFDFKIEGEWYGDSMAAALNGTNVLLLAASQVETKVTLNSGLVDVTPYSGTTSEFFVGIIGGMSTNALLTVQNVAFYTAAPPSLRAEASGNGLQVSWPLTTQNFNLESTINLTATNSWAAVTNVPAVLDLQNMVTNAISGGARFYRLKK